MPGVAHGRERRAEETGVEACSHVMTADSTGDKEKDRLTDGGEDERGQSSTAVADLAAAQRLGGLKRGGLVRAPGDVHKVRETTGKTPRNPEPGLAAFASPE